MYLYSFHITVISCSLYTLTMSGSVLCGNIHSHIIQ